MYSAYLLIVAIFVVSYTNAFESQKTISKVADTNNRIKAHRLFKRGSVRFLNTYGRLPFKRTDNHINTIPEYPQPKMEEPDIGSEIMDEFLLFLTLKDTGMLDMCLNMPGGGFF